jgi:hypothetical protein
VPQRTERPDEQQPGPPPREDELNGEWLDRAINSDRDPPRRDPPRRRDPPVDRPRTEREEI